MNDDSAFCSACGAKVFDNNYSGQQYNTNGYGYSQGDVNHQSNYNQQFPYGNQAMGYGYGTSNENAANFQMREKQQIDILITTYSSKIKTQGIMWLTIGILQVIIGLLTTYYNVSGMVSLMFLLIIGIYNIIISTTLLNLANKFLTQKKGMSEYIRKNKLSNIIATGIFNLLFGGVIGVLPTIYEVTVYNYGKEHEIEFWQFEQYK
ncbi:MAG: hypothetical protein IJ736_08840 [Firmicutes bacterium]|nr:hypothetical protein [Bacillota bacterium]